MKEEDKNIKDKECVKNTQDETCNKSKADETTNEEATADDKNKNEEESVQSDSKEQETDPLEKAQDEIAQLKDKYLRSVAEFDNYRKRTLKEKAELILNGSEKAIQAILPIIDDMERALAKSEKTDDV